MMTGAALLAALDASLPFDAARIARHAGGTDDIRTGIDAAIRLDALLTRHRLSWDEVITPAGRLAKLCGRLGSTFDGERGAAYDHALRFILGSHATWSRFVHLPGLVAAAVDPAPEPASEEPPGPALSAPDEDWLTTVQRLRRGEAWRSASEHALLNELEQELSAGQTLSAADARRVRDIWWYAELQATNPPEAWL